MCLFSLVAIRKKRSRLYEIQDTCESTRYGLELFKKLNLQLLIVTPLQKIHVIEGHVNSLHFVSNREGNNSQVSNFTKEEYETERDKHNGVFQNTPDL